MKSPTQKEKQEGIKKIRQHKYVGETARSGYERGLEHQKDWEDLKINSHMVKHYFDEHEGENPKDMIFGMRILKNHRTAFNRQISESVMIQTEKQHHNILNSKSEYNRCALPRLTAKVGEENLKKLEKRKQEEKLAEDELGRKIRTLRMTISRDKNNLPRKSVG